MGRGSKDMVVSDQESRNLIFDRQYWCHAHECPYGELKLAYRKGLHGRAKPQLPTFNQSYRRWKQVLNGSKLSSRASVSQADHWHSRAAACPIPPPAL